MNREVITIKNGKVSIPKSVSMQAFEIANLFGVYVQTVSANIKAIIKSGVVSPDTSGQVIANGSTIVPIDFGLEMITALAFRIGTHNAKVFREWLMKKAISTSTSQQVLICNHWNQLSSLN